MSSNDLIWDRTLKENIGIPNAMKGTTSAKRNLFQNSKKVLADVKNTFNSKQCDSTELGVKKQLNDVFKKEFFNTNNSTTKGISNKIETVAYVPETVINEDYTDEDDCPHCMNDEEDLLDIYEWPEEINLNEDYIKKLCFDPNPKSRYTPSPVRDIYWWYKETGISMSPPYLSPSRDYDNSPFKLPADYFNHDDIEPVYN